MCTFFGIRPPAPAVDPEGRSGREVDRFCVVHRARAGEGSCVLCGRRLPWAVLEDSSRVGCCRPCYAERYGERGAHELEEAWAKEKEEDTGEAA
jgi:hypothetical protein